MQKRTGIRYTVFTELDNTRRSEMNERICELYKQAMVTVPENPGNKEFTYFDPEKFAQLIVKEYEKLLPEICPWDQANKEGPMKGWHVQFVARKHFGIEE